MHAIDLAWRRATTEVGLIAWTAHPRTWTLTRITAPEGVLFGFGRADWTRPGFWIERIVPSDRAGVEAFFAAIARGEAMSVIEYRVHDAAGDLRVVRTNADLVADDDRSVIAGVHLDVTREYEATKALEAAERRYTLATQLGGAALWEYDQSGTSLQWDPVLLGLLGFDPASPPSNEEWLSRIHPDDRQRVVEQTQRVIADGVTSQLAPGRVPRLAFRVRAGSGDWRWLAKTETMVENNGHGPRLAAVIADITPEVHEREARRRAESLYREIWNSIPASAVALNAFGEIVEANPAWQEAARAGSAPRAFVGESYLAVTQRAAERGDPVAARALEGVRGVLSRHTKRFTLEYECPFPDRGDRWFRMNAFALQRPSRGAIVIHWDITDRKVSEMAIQKARDNLADMQRLTTMSELATSIAHELNQPLATIMAAASTARRLLRENSSRGDLKPIIEDVIEATARAAEVMRRARAMIRRDTHLRESLTLNEIVVAVSRLLASDLVIHQVALTMDLAADLPSVLGDRIQLQQVLLNLLLNAVEAVKEQPRDRRRIAVTTTCAGAERVEMVVSDTGHGVAPTLAAQIFDPFTTTKHDGTGLGLAIVRAIVEAHGGRVSVESPAEGGAAFRVSLPSELEVTDVTHRAAGSYATVATRGRR